MMLPESLTYIRGEAFQSCPNLTKITIPANVTEIGDNAFKDCETLETVNILALNPTLPELAVFENTPVKTVHYAGTEAQWHVDDTVLAEILQRVIADVGNIGCNAFGAELGVSGFGLEFGDVNGSEHIVAHDLFVKKYSRDPRPAPSSSSDGQ